MIVIRPIQTRDFEDYVKFAYDSHINFSTLPKERRLLEHRMDKTLESFRSHVTNPEREYYLFVAEDVRTKKLLGVAGISATTGGNEPLYFFRREMLQVKSSLEAVVKEVPVLSPISYVRGPSELCSLYVLPDARGLGVGKLLSLSRFLFIARFPERFTGSFIAELRGPVVNNTSPFWEGLGRHFFTLSFQEVHELLRFGRSFIAEFLPKYPIYINLLPQEVQDAIGQVDVETMGAFSLLKRQGFEVSDEVDVVDAGPKLRALKEHITAISQSVSAQVIEISDAYNDSEHVIVSNERIGFRCMYGHVHLHEGMKATISQDTASFLEVGLGDTIRFLKLQARP